LHASTDVLDKINENLNSEQWFHLGYIYFKGSSVSIVYGLDDRDSIPGKGNDGILPFATASRLALGPTQPPVQWVLEELRW